MRREVLTRKEMLHLLSRHSGGGTGELSGELADLLRDAVAPSLLPRWQQTADELARQLSQLLRAPVMVALLKQDQQPADLGFDLGHFAEP